MEQKLTHEQLLKTTTVQKLTQQQLLQVRLIGMSVTELEENIKAELDDNPALDADTGDDSAEREDDLTPEPEEESFEQAAEREERQEALDAALENMGSDDEMPQTYAPNGRPEGEYIEPVFANSVSFIDTLRAQLGELDLDERRQLIMEYLIGSLDNDGWLRKDLADLADELSIYQYIEVSEQELAELLKSLQSFDPPGIGARNLQECLLLQVDRLLDNSPGESKLLLKTMREILAHHFEAWRKNHWGTIREQLKLTPEQVEELQSEIKRRLNPKPGAAFSETQSSAMQQIVPDFIVETSLDGNVSFYLNRGQLPAVSVSESFANMLERYKADRKTLNRKDKEAMIYLKDKVTRAENYVEALRQRRLTLYNTMRVIIEKQRDFFREGDEAELKPMILKDIAEETGYDISTISRVCNQKYAQTKWGTFCLRHFFSDSVTTDDGEELSTRKLKVTLKEMIENEDKQHPLNDDTLARLMQEKGLPLARRTVTKYREQMGIPVARLRKETTR